MRLFRKCLLATAFVCLTANAGFGQTVSWKDNASDGRTKASATVTMNRDCNNPSIKYRFDARKTGINGSGRSLMTFVLLDQDGDVVLKKAQSLTIGAELDGLAKKNFEQELKLFDCNFFGAVGGYLKVEASDRNWAKDAQVIAQDIIDNVVNEVKAMGAKDIAKAFAGGEFIPF